MRSWIYDRVILKLTTRWYEEVISRLEPESVVLDVGIGPGGALVNNAAIVRDKKLRWTGVDIDSTYLDAARERVDEAGIGPQVDILHQSVYDHDGGPYDAVYFGASFMLMPDPEAALRHVCSLLSPGGRVFFTQTFHEKRNPVMEKIKPMLHRFTTVHFGRVTYEADFRATINQADCVLDELAVMDTSGNTSYRLAAVRPRPTA